MAFLAKFRYLINFVFITSDILFYYGITIIYGDLTKTTKEIVMRKNDKKIMYGLSQIKKIASVSICDINSIREEFNLLTYRRRFIERVINNIKGQFVRIFSTNMLYDSVFNLIGCGIITLKLQLLKSIIANNYSYVDAIEKYGKKYHIGHVFPVKAFDLSDPQQIREAFNYRNTQVVLNKDDTPSLVKFYLNNKNVVEKEISISKKIEHIVNVEHVSPFW